MNPGRFLHPMEAAWPREGRRGTAGRDGRRRRPALEVMESRRLLSTVNEYPLTSAVSVPWGIVAGPDGNLWFTDQSKSEIGEISPATKKIDEYPTPTANASPLSIAVGPDGNLWFTEYAAGKIGMIDPATRKIVEFATPSQESDPYGIVAGPDGNFWFTENSYKHSQVAFLNPTTRIITEFPTPTAGAGPQDIAVGPDGNLWFTEWDVGKIGVVDMGTHKITEIATPTASSAPSGITAGPDGQVWFTEQLGAIASIDPATRKIVETKVPIVGASPGSMILGPDRQLWFSVDGPMLAAIDPVTRLFTSTPISGPGPFEVPRGFAAGPDGNLWFTDSADSAIGVLAESLAVVVSAEPPPQVAPGATFGLTVSVVYPSGQVNTAFGGDVSLTLVPEAGTGAASLGGTTTVAAHYGVASFSGLTIGGSGTYRIQAALDLLRTTLTTPVAVVGSLATAGGSPMIVATAPLLTGRGRRKRLAGFELDFSAAMDPARAADAAEYSLVQFRRRRHRRVAQAVRFRASYDAAAHRVELMVSGRPKFAAGGKLVLVGGAGGLVDASGAPLVGGASFVIAPKGRTLSY